MNKVSRFMWFDKPDYLSVLLYTTPQGLGTQDFFLWSEILHLNKI